MSKSIQNAIVIVVTFSSITTASSYYVDYTSGYDGSTGDTPSSAWKTLSRVNSANFMPGDSVYFRRGSVWTGQLSISRSGTQFTPITFTAYDSGESPVIRNPGVNYGSAIRITADYVVVENFIVREAHEAGILVASGADHTIIRNNEATQVGIGVSVRGRYNLITNNFAHDLTMVVNTQGGDDDYGAVGIWTFSSNNEISYNRMFNCKAPSYDYGYDGGVVEFYGDVDSCHVHHNRGEYCNGAFEVGGSGQTLTDNVIAYNVYINNEVSGGFHVGGIFGVNFDNMRIENNVFFDTSTRDYAVGFWNGIPDPADFLYRNNIFYIPNHKRVSNQSGFIHQNNLYYLGGKTNVGFTPGTGDKIGDPLFTGVDEKNFHLQAGSPAIDAGIELGYNLDFDGNRVPVGIAPDIGVYEYGSTGFIKKRIREKSSLYGISISNFSVNGIMIATGGSDLIHGVEVYNVKGKPVLNRKRLDAPSVRIGGNSLSSGFHIIKIQVNSDIQIFKTVFIE